MGIAESTRDAAVTTVNNSAVGLEKSADLRRRSAIRLVWFDYQWINRQRLLSQIRHDGTEELLFRLTGGRDGAWTAMTLPITD
jgi:hypothetical protein